MKSPTVLHADELGPAVLLGDLVHHRELVRVHAACADVANLQQTETGWRTSVFEMLAHLCRTGRDRAELSSSPRSASQDQSAEPVREQASWVSQQERDTHLVQIDVGRLQALERAFNRIPGNKTSGIEVSSDTNSAHDVFARQSAVVRAFAIRIARLGRNDDI